MRSPRNHIFSAFIAILLGLFSTQASAAASADLWEYWDQHNASSNKTIDHGRWNSFLKKYVSTHKDGVNRVNYAAAKKKGRKALNQYIQAMSGITITDYNRDQQRAYWTNLYNAVTVKEILDNYPLASIRDIKSGVLSSGPWGKDLVTVENKALTLDDIEHRILRPIWQDPRTHYAVNCASIGCPNLLPKAFTAANMEAMLDKAAADYINHPRGVKVKSGKLTASSIYVWFEDDFGGNEAGVIEHLKQYAKPKLLAQLKNVDGVDRDTYDWSLNEDKPAKKSAKKKKSGSYTNK